MPLSSGTEYDGDRDNVQNVENSLHTDATCRPKRFLCRWFVLRDVSLLHHRCFELIFYISLEGTTIFNFTLNLAQKIFKDNGLVKEKMWSTRDDQKQDKLNLFLQH